MKGGEGIRRTGRGEGLEEGEEEEEQWEVRREERWEVRREEERGQKVLCV